MDKNMRAAAATIAAAGVACLIVRKLRKSLKPQGASPIEAGNALSNFLRLVRAKNMTQMLIGQRLSHGDTFIISIPPLLPRTCVVMDIESVHAVMALESKLNLTLSLPSTCAALHGNDLQHLSGSAHKLLRRTLNHVVSPRALDSYAPRLLAAFEQMWQGLVDCGGEIVIRDAVRRTQLRAMADILYGARFEDESEFDRLDEDFETEVAGLFAAPINLPGTTFRKALQAAARIREYLKDLLKKEVERQAACAADKVKENSPAGQKPLRSAIEAIVELHMSPDKEIRDVVANEQLVVDNLLLLLEAAQGTTMLATTALISELHRAGHEQALARARAEALALIGGDDKAGIWDRSMLQVAALERMEFTDACINETLRLYPQVGALTEKLPAGQTLEVGGKVVRGPIHVMLSFAHAFEDPAVFPRPLEFLPERWLKGTPEAVSEAARRAFLPFGLGRHVCLGYNIARLSMKITLVAMFGGGYRVEVRGPLERVPDVFPTYKIGNGGVALVTRA